MQLVLLKMKGCGWCVEQEKNWDGIAKAAQEKFPCIKTFKAMYIDEGNCQKYAKPGQGFPQTVLVNDADKAVAWHVGYMKCPAEIIACIAKYLKAHGLYAGQRPHIKRQSLMIRSSVKRSHAKRSHKKRCSVKRSHTKRSSAKRSKRHSNKRHCK